MLDIGSTELLMIVIVAIVVIGPKDLPRALYKLGQIVGKAKDVARHFRTGVDAMVREVELEEMEKKWKADNERIMRDHPALQTSAPSDAATASLEADAAATTAPVMQPLPSTATPAPEPAPAAAATPASEGER